ncbi:hypothetical protein XENTR_v10014896 [Xenopus tropicalis]|nr:hypothetical protein XENTR_v10014896 [Xenopus tropicalis]
MKIQMTERPIPVYDCKHFIPAKEMKVAAMDAEKMLDFSKGRKRLRKESRRHKKWEPNNIDLLAHSLVAHSCDQFTIIVFVMLAAVLILMPIIVIFMSEDMVSEAHYHLNLLEKSL